MLQLSIAGRTGRDAQHKTTQGGTELCNFTIAADVGFGDSKQTVWVDVTRWGKGAKGLADCLPKGTPVAVTGEMSLREHDGKTYVQCRADRVTLLGKREGQSSGSQGADRNSGGTQGDQGRYDDNLDDDIPFDGR